MIKKEWSIGQLSRLSGINVQSIRHYERIGLLDEPARTVNGHRRYTQNHLNVLNLISQGRKAGFRLDDIRKLTKCLALNNIPPCETFQALALKHAQEVESRRKELKKYERLLITLAGICVDCICSGRNKEVQGNLAACALLNDMKKNSIQTEDLAFPKRRCISQNNNTGL